MGLKGSLWCLFVPKRSKISQDIAELLPFLQKPIRISSKPFKVILGVKWSPERKKKGKERKRATVVFC